MSDTRGWKCVLNQYTKEINGKRYYLKKSSRSGTDYYRVWCADWSSLFVKRRDAQRAAHRHAEGMS